MLELNWYKIFDLHKKENNWYVYAKLQEQLSIADITQHMQEHNTPFSKGTIEGLLNDFVQCIHEQLLNGKSVKIDNLAIFRLAVESNAFKSPGEVSKETARLGVRAAAGDTDGRQTGSARSQLGEWLGQRGRRARRQEVKKVPG